MRRLISLDKPKVASVGSWSLLICYQRPWHCGEIKGSNKMANKQCSPTRNKISTYNFADFLWSVLILSVNNEWVFLEAKKRTYHLFLVLYWLCKEISQLLPEVQGYSKRVYPGLKPQSQVFSWRGSYNKYSAGQALKEPSDHIFGMQYCMVKRHSSNFRITASTFSGVWIC